VTSQEVAWQASLWDGAEPDVDETFSGLTRIELDPTAWVDHAPAWVSGSDELLALLIDTFEWAQRSRRMYDKTVREPRLTSWWSASSGRELAPPVLEKMRRALSHRYGVELDSMGLNLYRDGRDSVAWHGDRIARHIAEPVVAIVSVGEPRRFQLRPRAPGPAPRTFLLGRGDLLVTGGTCQRTWLHSVPKVASAGPRISITFRHGLDPRAYPEESRRDS
jgi:alkylated DNA repair dioxygenase AlkB